MPQHVETQPLGNNWAQGEEWRKTYAYCELTRPTPPEVRPARVVKRAQADDATGKAVWTSEPLTRRPPTIKPATHEIVNKRPPSPRNAVRPWNLPTQATGPNQNRCSKVFFARFRDLRWLCYIWLYYGWSKEILRFIATRTKITNWGRLISINWC